MAIKRLKVALKRKDWSMFEYGLARIVELQNSGTPLVDISEWNSILVQTRSEKVPDNLLVKLESLIDHITPGEPQPLQSLEHSPEPEENHFQEEHTPESTEENGHTEEQQAQNEVGESFPPVEQASASVIKRNMSNVIPLTVFINNYPGLEALKAVHKLRYAIQKIQLDEESSIEYSLLSDLSKLYSTLAKSKMSLDGLERVLTAESQAGVIVTTGYDAELIKLLEANNVDYTIDGIKEGKSSNAWKIYPLAGMSAIHYCPSCNSRTLSTSDFEKVIGSCNLCHSATLPDLYRIDTDFSEKSAYFWHKACTALEDAANLVLAYPPNYHDKNVVTNLILDTYRESYAEKVFVVTNNRDNANLWMKQLSEMGNKHLPSRLYYNFDALANNYAE